LFAHFYSFFPVPAITKQTSPICTSLSYSCRLVFVQPQDLQCQDLPSGRGSPWSVLRSAMLSAFFTFTHPCVVSL